MNAFTRTVSLWLNNDEGLYSNAVEAAREVFQELVDSDDYTAEDVDMLRNDASTKLGSWINETLSADVPCRRGVWGDLVSIVFDEIDFDEVAEEFLDDSGYLYLTVDGSPAEGTLGLIADNEHDLCEAIEAALGELSDDDSCTLWKAQTGEPFIVAGHVYMIKKV